MENHPQIEAEDISERESFVEDTGRSGFNMESSFLSPKDAEPNNHQNFINDPIQIQDGTNSDHQLHDGDGTPRNADNMFSEDDSNYKGRIYASMLLKETDVASLQEI